MRDAWAVAFVALALAVTVVTIDEHARRLPKLLSGVFAFLAPILVVVAAGAAVAGIVTW